MAMQTLQSFATTLWELPQNFHGDYVEQTYETYMDLMLACEVFYVLFVFYGPRFMENRKPMRLRAVSAVWNLLLSAYSFIGTRAMIILVMFHMKHRGFYLTTCYFDMHYSFDGELAFWLYSFTLSKIPEMFDTVLLVLQKKPVIFLHWYHHLTVLIFCWYSGRVLNPSGLWFALINFAVHSIMYAYYFFCSIGLRRLVRPVAPLITAAQLLQMVVGVGIVLYTVYYSYISPRGCGVDRRVIRMGILMYGSYVVLFAALFSRLYLSKNKREGRISSSGSKAEVKEAATVTSATTSGSKVVNGSKPQKKKAGNNNSNNNNAGDDDNVSSSAATHTVRSSTDGGATSTDSSRGTSDGVSGVVDSTSMIYSVSERTRQSSQNKSPRNSSDKASRRSGQK